MHPLLDLAAARALEERVLGGDPAREWSAMVRAGAALAAGIGADFTEAGPWPAAPRILVLAGKGHNGGDALLAAAGLVERHPQAEIAVLAAASSADWRPWTCRAWEHLDRVCSGRAALRVWNGASPPRGMGEGPWTLVIDGLLGMSATGPLRDPLPALLAWVNLQTACFRAAVDLPTGLGGGGGAVFCADATYATGSVKAPVAARAAVAQVGRLRALDLGFFAGTAADPVATGVLTDDLLDPWRRLRGAHLDKRAFGHVLLVGGSHAYPGAIQLAARAALHGGAGLVTAALPAAFAPAAAAALPEVMWLGLPESPEGGIALEGFHLLRNVLERATALVVGPGLSTDPEARAFTERLLAETRQPVLIDADALQPAVLAAVRSADPERTFVLTPHDGEAARLGIPIGTATDADPFAEAAALRSWCKQHGAILVRKGPAPRVVDATRWALAPAGGPVLARGGSGDLLAGLAGAFLATAQPAWEATAAAVLLHVRAGDLLARQSGATTTHTSSLLDHLPAALAGVS